MAACGLLDAFSECALMAVSMLPINLCLLKQMVFAPLIFTLIDSFGRDSRHLQLLYLSDADKS